MFTTNRILIALGLVLVAGVWCAADWWIAIPKDAVATYVGRESCATCHATELHRWTGSHHDRAMELATEENVVGDFDDVSLRTLWSREPLLQARRQVLGEHRRAGRRIPRLRNQIHLRHRPDAAVHGGIPRWQGAGAPRFLGHAQRRVVLCLSHGRGGRTHSARRSAALDGHRPELEHHVRRMPFDQREEELQSSFEYLRHDVLGNRRQLRNVPRPGQPARRDRREQFDLLGPQSRLRSGRVEKRGKRSGDRQLCSLPFATGAVARGVLRRRPLSRLLPTFADTQRAVSRRWADS